MRLPLPVTQWRRSHADLKPFWTRLETPPQLAHWRGPVVGQTSWGELLPVPGRSVPAGAGSARSGPARAKLSRPGPARAGPARPGRSRPGPTSLRPAGPLSKKLFTLFDLCVSSLRRGHANLLCIVPILTDDPRRESVSLCFMSSLTHFQPRICFANSRRIKTACNSEQVCGYMYPINASPLVH